jgi:hypothetical protein
MMEMIKSLTKQLCLPSHPSLKCVSQLMRYPAAQAEESLITRRYSAAPSTAGSNSHSPNAFWTETSTPGPRTEVSLDFLGEANELVSLDDTSDLFADSQWARPELQLLDLATDDKFSTLAPVQKGSSLLPQGAVMTHDGEEKGAEELAPPHVLNELCDNAPGFFKLVTGLTSNRYTIYFDKAHNEYSMMKKDRFLSRIHDPLSGLETQSLKLIVLAHAASVSPHQAHLSRRFYELSRKYFEQVELGKGFLTITALQSCILLALFELKQALFTRAWNSVSRANWMVQIFGLQKIDGISTSYVQEQEHSHLLPPTIDAWEIEERRRTFWSAFNLSCSASIGAGWKTYVPANYADVRNYPDTYIYIAPKLT